MGYVPDNAKWYLAELVIEFRIVGDDRNVIHTNTVLIRADSPEEAYQKALLRGQEEEDSYTNTDEQDVDVLFRGLADLYVIYEELEDGAEIIYSEEIGVSEAELCERILPKENLAVFEDLQRPSRSRPNTLPKTIMDALRESGLDEDDLYLPPEDDVM